MTTTPHELESQPAGTKERKDRMGQIIERMGTGLGDGVGFLADSGVLFVLFAIIWVGFGAALLWSQGSVDAVWSTVRAWPWYLEGIVWVAFLPVMVGVWIWETAWPQLWRLMGLVVLASWTLVIFPRPWK